MAGTYRLISHFTLYEDWFELHDSNTIYNKMTLILKAKHAPLWHINFKSNFYKA